jgi:hypothetical protein
VVNILAPNACPPAPQRRVAEAYRKRYGTTI